MKLPKFQSKNSAAFKAILLWKKQFSNWQEQMWPLQTTNKDYT